MTCYEACEILNLGYATTRPGPRPGHKMRVAQPLSAVPPVFFREVIRRGSDDLHLAAGAALAVDHLAALFGGHPGAEADLAGTLHFADLVRVMHRVLCLS